ncbi:hypothetical protein GXP67_26360 [Rhodocytophaga rosea]|uniref:Uncharacterized protein n=1 Tax=Rhodocytophaga rosea TaxID=2704465 RepID=A0A6C0GPD9_9BACT|nr:hypothetical protein [Rhodocytophaga rosea]QHT69916.1 hypothetical protein GXP67_26360 [Rhodocytophaga rosea]
MKVIGVVLFVAVLAACQPNSKQLDLISHWHVHYPDSMFGTWDILDTSQIIIDKHRFWGYYHTIGYWHMNSEVANSDTIRVAYNSHSYSDFTYKYQNDTLFLSDKSYAIKIDTNQCNLPEEFFGDLHVAIELPSSGETKELTEEENRRSLFLHMYIGKPKPYVKKIPKDTFLIEVVRGDFFIDYTGIQEFVEVEKAMLPSAERDSITVAFSVHKQAPAHMVDSIEQIINWDYPPLKIIYACLPGEKQYVKESVFTSLKNEFAKPADQCTAIVVFDVTEAGQVRWALKENANENLIYYSLEEAESTERLRSLWQKAKTNKQKPGIAFSFAHKATFQDYITAQTTIKRALKEISL